MGIVGWFVGTAIGAIFVIFGAPLLLWPLIPASITGGWLDVLKLIIGAGIIALSWKIGSMFI